MLFKFFTEVWGLIGLIALVVAMALLFRTPQGKIRKYLFPRSINEKYVIAWLIAVDLYIILFLRFPVETGYLIPIVPFVILIFGKYLYEKAFIFFAVALIISPFIFSASPIDRNDAPAPTKASFIVSLGGEKLVFDLQGSIFTHQSRRENGIAFTNQVLESLDTLKTKTLIIAGTWYNQIALKRTETLQTKEEIQLRDYIDQDSLLYFIGKGYSIYYLPKQDINNLLIRKVDIGLYGAEPYIKKNPY